MKLSDLENIAISSEAIDMLLPGCPYQKKKRHTALGETYFFTLEAAYICAWNYCYTELIGCPERLMLWDGEQSNKRLCNQSM